MKIKFVQTKLIIAPYNLIELIKQIEKKGKGESAGQNRKGNQVAFKLGYNGWLIFILRYFSLESYIACCGRSSNKLLYVNGRFYLSLTINSFFQASL